MNEPLVSVLIPSYNHSKFIKRTINSVIKQTVHDIEIIISDDGSTDDTVKIIKEFNDPRIRLFAHSENKGASISYLTCLNQARGHYLALISSDDEWLPQKLEKQIEVLKANPNIEAVFTWPEIIDENNNLLPDDNPYSSIFNQKNRSRFEWLNFFFYNGNCLCHPSVLTRRGLYESFQKEDLRLRQLPDFLVWIKICSLKEIFIIEEPLVKFRILNDGKNTSSGLTPNLIRLEFEKTIISKEFLRLAKGDDFYKVFPEALLQKSQSLPANLESRKIFSQMCLNHKEKGFQLTGIETLYDLALEHQKDSNSLDTPLIEVKYLHEITQKIDIFRLITEQQEEILKQNIIEINKQVNQLKSRSAELHGELDRIKNSLGYRLTKSNFFKTLEILIKIFSTFSERFFGKFK